MAMGTFRLNVSPALRSAPWTPHRGSDIIWSTAVCSNVLICVLSAESLDATVCLCSVHVLYHQRPSVHRSLWKVLSQCWILKHTPSCSKTVLCRVQFVAVNGHGGVRGSLLFLIRDKSLVQVRCGGQASWNWCRASSTRSPGCGYCLRLGTVVTGDWFMGLVWRLGYLSATRSMGNPSLSPQDLGQSCCCSSFTTLSRCSLASRSCIKSARSCSRSASACCSFIWRSSIW